MPTENCPASDKAMFIDPPSIENFQTTPRDEFVMHALWASHEQMLRSGTLIGVSPLRQRRMEKERLDELAE